jgi:hypothetical protein
MDVCFLVGQRARPHVDEYSGHREPHRDADVLRQRPFGFKDTLVTFENAGGKASRLRLDTGGGYNFLSRQSDSRK